MNSGTTRVWRLLGSGSPLPTDLEIANSATAIQQWGQRELPGADEQQTQKSREDHAGQPNRIMIPGEVEATECRVIMP